MFYCEPCAEKNGWPKAFWLPLSHGKCEWCGEVSVCFDVPCSSLPPVKKQTPESEVTK